MKSTAFSNILFIPCDFINVLTYETVHVIIRKNSPFTADPDYIYIQIYIHTYIS